MSHGEANRTDQLRTGYFGKLPSNGDFVSRGLSAALTDPLDRWLGAVIRAGQREMGPAWLDAFLVAPAWRGAVPAGLLGPDTVALVMIPSVDRVGRYFPLVLATAIHGPPRLATSLPEALGAWYDAAEALALSTLTLDFARTALDGALDRPDGPLAPPPPRAAQVPAGDVDAASLFWTRDGTAPLRTDGLPAPEAFHGAFLGGKAAGRPAAEASGPTRVLIQADMAASATKGTRSRTLADAAAFGGGNQAATLLSGIGADIRLPGAVAQAARLLEGVEHPFSMKDLVAEAKGKLGTANAQLRARSAPTGEVLAASSATLLLQGGRHAILWVGNVRAYLLRDGLLHRLTRDHAEPGMSNLITRALGAEVNLTLDTAIGEVRDGDRFLLASPGLHGALPERNIAETLASAASARQAAAHLTQDALISRAILDVAAIVVLCSARES